MDKEEKDKEEKDMGAITGDQSKVNKTSEGISKSFLKTAKRLPRKDGKIVLDRNNPEHVSWAEGYKKK
ncbi:hypothetical protein MKX42_14470 [Paenibacillus sp. FSL R7-0204]|uniref:hypothetical protein n=1 Tax=unclassified Paenibacillus TaxID=185978 RepID=UPI0030DA60E7